ncbi:hypothetical protein BHE74_00046586 [Ensete ventricosum]|nr:hypothetical protein BHE74_00046586 [Ensete ventricosum]RZS06405.1 hypothetical protein BHM03_00037050 [Ensete ventricosum]
MRAWAMTNRRCPFGPIPKLIDPKLDVSKSVPDPPAFGGLVEVGLSDHLREALVHALPPHGDRAKRHRGSGSYPSVDPLFLPPLFPLALDLVLVIVLLAAREPTPS